MIDWIGDRFKAMGDNLASIPSALSKVGDGIATGASTVWKGVSWAGEKTWAGLSYVATNPITCAKEIGNFGKYVWDNPVEAGSLATQGLLNAGSSLVGLAGDAISNGATLIYNSASFTVNAVPNFLGLGDVTPYQKFPGMAATRWLLEKSDLGIVADIEKNQGRPLNGYQKTILYGTQGVGEVAVFVGVSAVTAGVGGAFLVSARSAGLAHRAQMMARTGRLMVYTPGELSMSKNFATYAAKGARFGMPLMNKYGTTIEAAGIALTMKLSWDQYSKDVESGDNKIAQALGGEQLDSALSWDELRALSEGNLSVEHNKAASNIVQEGALSWDQLIELENARSSTMAYARDGSMIKDAQNNAAKGITTETTNLDGNEPQDLILTDELNR